MSMIVVSSQDKAIRFEVINRLQAVANIQEERLQAVIDRYLEQTQLITSRTQLRKNIQAYNEGGEEALLASSKNILTDAVRGTSDVLEITLFDLNGNVLVSTKNGERLDSRDDIAAIRSHTFDTLFKDEENLVRVRLLGPLVLDGDIIAVAEVVASAGPIFSVTEEYIGLGETGEVLIGKKNKNGDALFLTPLRFDAGAAITRAVPKTRNETPITSAVLGKEAVFTGEGTIDYRGKPVLAVTRFIDSVEWGIVAKIDRDEAFSSIQRLQKTVSIIVLETIVIIFIISAVVSKVIARPLRELTSVVRAMRGKEFKKRVVVRGSDEVATLAESFNVMSEEIEESYTNLEKKVKERTKDLVTAQDALKDKINDLERFNKLTVDRELKMVELKEQLKKKDSQNNKEQ